MKQSNRWFGLFISKEKANQTSYPAQERALIFSAALRPFLRSQEVLRRIGARIIVELALISARPLAYLAQARDGHVLIPSREETLVHRR